MDYIKAFYNKIDKVQKIGKTYCNLNKAVSINVLNCKY